MKYAEDLITLKDTLLLITRLKTAGDNQASVPQIIDLISQIALKVRQLSNRKNSLRLITNPKLWQYIEHLSDLFYQVKLNGKPTPYAHYSIKNLTPIYTELTENLDRWINILIIRIQNKVELIKDGKETGSSLEEYPTITDIMKFFVDISRLNLSHYNLLRVPQISAVWHGQTLRQQHQLRVLFRILEVLGECFKDVSHEFKAHFSNFAPVFIALAHIRDILAHRTDPEFSAVWNIIEALSDNEEMVTALVTKLSTQLNQFGLAVRAFKAQWALRRPEFTIHIDRRYVRHAPQLEPLMLQTFNDLYTLIAKSRTPLPLHPFYFGSSPTLRYSLLKLFQIIEQLVAFNKHLNFDFTASNVVTNRKAENLAIVFYWEFSIASAGQVAKKILHDTNFNPEILKEFKDALLNLESVRDNLMHPFYNFVKGLKSAVAFTTKVLIHRMEVYSALANAYVLHDRMLEQEIQLKEVLIPTLEHKQASHERAVTAAELKIELADLNTKLQWKETANAKKSQITILNEKRNAILARIGSLQIIQQRIVSRQVRDCGNIELVPLPKIQQAVGLMSTNLELAIKPHQQLVHACLLWQSRLSLTYARLTDLTRTLNNNNEEIKQLAEIDDETVLRLS